MRFNRFEIGLKPVHGNSDRFDFESVKNLLSGFCDGLPPSFRTFYRCSSAAAGGLPDDVRAVLERLAALPRSISSKRNLYKELGTTGPQWASDGIGSVVYLTREHIHREMVPRIVGGSLLDVDVLAALLRGGIRFQCLHYICDQRPTLLALTDLRPLLCRSAWSADASTMVLFSLVSNDAGLIEYLFTVPEFVAGLRDTPDAMLSPLRGALYLRQFQIYRFMRQFADLPYLAVVEDRILWKTALERKAPVDILVELGYHYEHPPVESLET